jgi:hypothetical protein
MKSFRQEPRLKVLNERLSASTTGSTTPRKPVINFICQSITIYGDLSIKFRFPGSSKDANKGTDEAKPPHTTRPQKSICIKSWSKRKVDSEQDFYPDMIKVDKSSPAVPGRESAASGFPTPDDDITTGQRPYCNSPRVSAKASGSGG